MNKTKIFAIRALVVVCALFTFYLLRTSPPAEAFLLFLAGAAFVLVKWIRAESDYEEYKKRINSNN